MRSLRGALVLGTTAGMAAVLAAAAGITYQLIRADLVEEFDRSLADSARLLASTMEQGPRKINGDFRKYDMREFEASERPGYLEVWRPDGSVFFRSPSLGASDLERIGGPFEAPACRPVELPDGRPGRAVGITFAPRVEKKKREGDAAERPAAAPRTVVLALARGTEAIEAPLARLAALFGAVGAAAIAIAAGVLWLVIWWSLKPVGRLAAQIGGIGERDLSARLDGREAPRELQPVVDRLNDLLGRLRAAFDRERTLTADVAHELRTPLAGLRSTAEVALSRSREAPEYREALGDCLEITQRMQALVENLLSLARLEAGQVESHPRPVVPPEMLRAAWKPLEEAARARRLTVDWALGSAEPVMTDPALLDLVIGNLLENAVAHADGGGSVRIETSAGAEALEIRITNSGSTLPPDRAQEVFERFWRGDAARASNGSHCGLGLPLVKKVVGVLGGEVAVRSTAGGDFEVEVSIPRRLPAGG